MRWITFFVFLSLFQVLLINASAHQEQLNTPLETKLKLDSTVSKSFGNESISGLLSDSAPIMIKVNVDQPVIKLTSEKIDIKQKISSMAELNVHADVINVLNRDISIVVYPCGNFNWKIDNQDLEIVSETCFENIPQKIILKPGEFYQKDIKVVLSSNAKSGAVEFRLGFVTEESEEELLPPIIWSNPVVVQVQLTANKNND